MIYAIDKVREQHKLPPYQWSPVELVELGVPRDIAETLSADEFSELVAKSGQ